MYAILIYFGSRSSLSKEIYFGQYKSFSFFSLLKPLSIGNLNNTIDEKFKNYHKTKIVSSDLSELFSFRNYFSFSNLKFRKSRAHLACYGDPYICVVGFNVVPFRRYPSIQLFGYWCILNCVNLWLFNRPKL